MYFKRLEMHGFKSFAEPVVIDFHEGVTCIVGPNGSGKSNISDAIRWVLGEQSPKMLRGGKMEEVIFSGTASRKSRGMAEVTLVIDNTTGILPIDYNEVAITRRMYRSGESEYLINNNHCRLRDIRELIMDTGIGVDGYSLIGQGKIADIVGNKPESRREIFEESAGIVMYKNKKADAEKKLGETNLNLERVNDTVFGYEERLPGLKEDSEKATEYLKLKERFKELEINIVLRNVEKLEEANKAFKNDIEIYTKDINSFDDDKKAIDDKLEEGRAKKHHLDEMESDSRNKLLSIIEEINRIENKSQLDAERLGNIERDLNRLDEDMTSHDEKLVRELGNLESLEKDQKEIKKELEESEANLAEKSRIHSDLARKTSEVSALIEEKKNKMFQLHGEVSSKRMEAKSYESFKENFKTRKEAILEETKERKESRRTYEETLNRAVEKKQEVDSEIIDLKAELKEYEKEQKDIMAESRELSKKIEELTINKTTLVTRKRTIEEMENNYEGYNNAVRFIMRNPAPGIRGVVADLMEVPSGYEVAIETALGAAMQNIVCDTDQDAKNAVRLLKERKAGRCTFLPTASIKGQMMRKDENLAKMNGYMGVAAQCIDFEPKYENIFAYLLGRVVIVDNMDNAVKLSKVAGNGIRLVTLDGEIINSSGAITGGKYKNATANLLERKQEILKLDEVIKVETDKLEESEERLGLIEASLINIAADIDEKNDLLRQAELEEGNLKARISALKESGRELDNADAKNERELASVDEEKAKAEEEIERLNHEADQAEEEIESVGEETQILLTQLEGLKEETSKANEAIVSVRIANTQCQGRLDSCEELIARVKGAIDEVSEQLDVCRENKENLIEEKEQILYGSDDTAKTAEDKKKEKIETEEGLNTIAARKAEIEEEVEGLHKEQSELRNKLDDIRDKKYQLEIRFGKNETQLETLKERLWDEFEVSYVQAMNFRKDDFVMSTATKESRDIKVRIKQLGNVNVGAIKEYSEVKERYEFLVEQRADILEATNQLKAIINDMDKTIKEKFKDNFDKIVMHFEEIFKQLFGGGYAELRLEDENNPLESGIEIIAQPPGKKLQNINLMSGGEKTMTAIALMFAVLKTKPTPFCILDEVEAALDDANIDRFAKYLRKFNNIQFAVVTHQKATMEHADVLYGVTMPEQGISKVLSLRLGDNFEL